MGGERSGSIGSRGALVDIEDGLSYLVGSLVRSVKRIREGERDNHVCS